MRITTSWTDRTEIIKPQNGASCRPSSILIASVLLWLATSSVFADSSTKVKKVSSVPAELTANVGVLNMTYVDPKTGVIQWTATTQQSQITTGLTGVAVGTMKNVRGVFYDSGKPADAFVALTVSADDNNKVVIASGSVKITSLTKADTSITCDVVKWYTEQNKLVGLGHVVCRSRGFTQTAPSFLADTKLKDIYMPVPKSGTTALGHVLFTP